MTGFICVACGVQFAPSDDPPPRCPICEDPRQYVPPGGQRWTTLEELAADRTAAIREEAGLTGIGADPSFAIGQRALLVPCGARRVMWDCAPLVDDAAVEEIERGGGLAAIAISHPHYYSTNVEWAHRLGCPVLIHEDDAEWVVRPDPAVELWSGETRDLGGGLTLIRCGGHFAGATVLHWPGGAGGRGTLLSGDVVQVIPDRTHVGFMYSYPNLIPLPDATVKAIGAALEPFEFEQIAGAWWGTVVPEDGKAVVRRSVERHGRALRGGM